MADIPYKHPETGEERNLPEGMGEGLGFERVQNYVPAELQEDEQKDSQMSPAEAAFAELEHAAGIVFGVVSNGVDSVDEPQKNVIYNLSNALEENGFGFVKDPAGSDFTGQEEQTGGPSLVDAVKLIEAQLDADETKTPQQKGSIRKYLTELLAAQPETPATGTSTTEPKESEQPGRSE